MTMEKQIESLEDRIDRLENPHKYRRSSKLHQAARKVEKERIKAFTDFAGDRPRLSDKQERVFYQICSAIPEDVTDPGIKKDRKEFVKQFLAVVDASEKLKAAQKSRKNLYESYLAFNTAEYELCGLETALLQSILAGYDDAVKVQKDIFIAKMNQRADIERAYTDKINIPTQGMNEKQRKSRAKMRKAAKEKYTKDVLALDIKAQRKGPLQECRVARSKINLSIKVLSAHLDIRYPIKNITENLSALEVGNLVDKMIKERSRKQAEKG